MNEKQEPVTLYVDEEEYTCAHRCSKWLRVLSFFAVNAIYATSGAATFSALERGYETETCSQAKLDYSEFLASLEYGKENNVTLTQEQIKVLIENVKQYTEEGLVVSAEGVECTNSWSFANALYFCFTIGTTVGYGDIAPKTFNGKIFFIFYVIPGICICGAFIGELSTIMYARLKRGKTRFLQFSEKVWIYWTVNSTFFFCICWLVPAAIVYAITDWSFFDSVYFSMVTFTTVGFGDFTITNYNFKFIIVAFSYFGLAWIGIVTSLAMEKIQSANKVATGSRKTVIEKSDSAEEVITHWTQC